MFTSYIIVYYCSVTRMVKFTCYVIVYYWSVTGMMRSTHCGWFIVTGPRVGEGCCSLLLQYERDDKVYTLCECTVLQG